MPGSPEPRTWFDWRLPVLIAVGASLGWLSLFAFTILGIFAGQLRLKRASPEPVTLLEAVLDDGFLLIATFCVLVGAEAGLQVFRHARLGVPRATRSRAATWVGHSSAVMATAGLVAVATVNEGRILYCAYLVATGVLVSDVRACRRPHPLAAGVLVAGVPLLILVRSFQT